MRGVFVYFPARRAGKDTEIAPRCGHSTNLVSDFPPSALCRGRLLQCVKKRQEFPKSIDAFLKRNILLYSVPKKAGVGSILTFYFQPFYLSVRAGIYKSSARQ